VVLVAASAPAFADSEHYEDVRVDVGLSGSSVSIAERNGAGMSVEIKGMANDNLSFGGRVEFAVMFGGAVGNEQEERLDISMVACGLLKAEYLLGLGVVRGFVGLGVGGYTISSQTVAAGTDHGGIRSETGRYFGVAPQVGVDIGRVRIAATYNALLGAQLELQQTVGNVERTSELSQNYLSLELSFQFAGGRKSTRARPLAPIASQR
jgi:hypothetical protein